MTIPHTTLADIARATGAQLTLPTDDTKLNAIVCDVTHDSRQVARGWLFVAIKGAVADGHKFINEVIEQGAVGIVSEQNPPAVGASVAWLQISHARRALAQIAHIVQGEPSRRLRLIGITGTNGKTTTAYIVSRIAEEAGERVAMLGTIERRIAAQRERTEHTTPEASDTNRFLGRAVDAGCGIAVMECSSQALDLRRCDALSFAVAAWTNLTQDHLDHHGDMNRYYLAKRQLFDNSIGSLPGVAVINTDDPAGLRLHHELKEISARPERIITYALDAAAADVRAENITHALGGMRFRLHTPAGTSDLHSPLVGRAMLYNILTASAIAIALGYDLDRIARAVKVCTGAPGRFERIAHAGDFAVIVDYAHTPDALTNTLRTAREVAPAGRIITVFGCGGDRDPAKRSPMGEAAANGSDLVILTSDNPRTEDPQQILRDTEVGLRMHRTPYVIEADRRRAVHAAINEARTSDLVLIAGKGHEDYQIIGTQKFHFDDCEVAREVLKTLT